MGFLDKVKKATNRDEETSDELSPEESEAAVSKQRKVEDVLEVLQIPATFDIPNDVFLPDDLKEIEFDTQVPYGYDLGQVTRFVGQTRTTVKLYVSLLKERNAHIAKLATVVDKLQVDANNLRFENEIANGISVMPTTDDEETEGRLTEALLENRRLEDVIKKLRAQVQASAGVDGATYETLLNEVSIAKREVEELNEENANLRAQLAHSDEMTDDEVALPGSPAVPASDALPEMGLQEELNSLPNLGSGNFDEDDEEDDFSPVLPQPSSSSRSGFNVDIPESNEPRSLPFEVDEDDSIDDIMKHWASED